MQYAFQSLRLPANLKTLLLLLLTGFCLNSAFGQQEGYLDNDFDADGLATSTVFGNGACLARAVAVQPDGKILLAGIADDVDGNAGLALMRFLPDGTPDNGFGNSALPGISDNPLGFGDVARAMVLQSDGNIVIGGGSSDQSGFSLRGYTAEGGYNNSFGNIPGGGGSTYTYFGGFTQLHAMAGHADGKIVAAGQSDYSGGADFALVRYTAAGVEDNTFSFDGKVTADFSNGSDVAYAVAVQADGKIVAAGHSSGKMALVRFRPDGNLDQAFGIGGKVTTAIGQEAYIADLAVQPDGKIVAAGFSLVDQVPQFTLVRYLPNGQLDTLFGNKGIASLPQGSFSALVLQPDGKIVAAGAYIPNAWAVVFRFLADGSLDPAFGGNGQSNYVFDAEFTDLALQADGKILAAGYTPTGGQSQFALARYLATFSVGAANPNRAGRENLIYPNPVAAGASFEFELEQAAPVSLEIVNSLGQMLRQPLAAASFSAGKQQIPLNLEGLMPGIYQLVLHAGDRLVTTQFVKQ